LPKQIKTHIMHTQRNVRLSKQAIEELELLLCCEVYSLHYEGCVYINKAGEVIQGGNKIDTLNTSAKVRALFVELLQEEGIY
jgi:hypothetical protein